MPALKLPPIDYSSRDYEAIRDDMVRAIPFYTEEWTDHNPTDFGIVLIELLAFVADGLHYYIDRAAAEAFLPTAIKRQSVINLLKLIDYELRSAVPASADVTFTLPQVFPEDVRIPAGTRLATAAEAGEDPVEFETVADLVIPAAETEGTVSAVEGRTQEEIAGRSDGTPFQRIRLSGAPIVDGTLRILIDEGAGEEPWTEVDSFVRTGPLDRHYYVQRDEQDRLTVFFGDNAQGRIPGAGASIRAVYRVGGGVRGNVGAGTIGTVVSVLTHRGSPLTVQVANPLAASGGEERQSIEDAKRQGPRTLRAMGRAVTLDDFEILAEDFPGIARARALLGAGAEGGCCCGVTVHVVPEGGGQMSADLRERLLARLEAVKMAGTCLELADAEYVEVDIDGVVFVGPTFVQAEVEQVFLDELDRFFLLDGAFVDFGRGVFLSDLYALIDGVDGVDHVDLAKVTRRPVPKLEVWSGDAAFEPVTVGPAAARETWTVTFTSPTEFSVRGTVSGIQAARGRLGVPYAADRGQVSFQITAGAGGRPMRAGDRASFVTSAFLGNVPLAPNEVMVRGSVRLGLAGGSRGTRRCG
ncbi:MAG: putative baseplate assembly protein [Trueperaceae bacterium]|nr:putative baseplate assembly protein [Trueperaceae bacterium]